MAYSDNDKRWLVTLIASNKIVAPVLREIVKQGMDKLYAFLDGQLSGLTPPCNLRTLTYATCPTPLRKDLQFQNINDNLNNHGKKKVDYNYNVNTAVDLAKLYLPGFLAVFSAFDESMDLSAALRLLGCKKYPTQIFFSSNPFVAVQSLADDVRENVRNPGGHFKESDWTQNFFDQCFDKLEALVNSLVLPAIEKKDLLDQLSERRTKGFQLIGDEDVKDLLMQKFQNVELDAIQEQLEELPTRDELNIMREKLSSFMSERFDAVEDLIRNATNEKRVHLKRDADIAASVPGSSDSVLPSGEMCQLNDKGSDVKESGTSSSGLSENASDSTGGKLPENQCRLQPDKGAQIQPRQVALKFQCVMQEDSGTAHFIDLGGIKLERIGDNMVFGCQLRHVADDLYRMPQQTEHEGASAIWIPEIHEGKNREMSCNLRTEEAKKSRGALHKAAINGRHEDVKALLENFEDVDQMDKFLLMPLHLAAWYGHEPVARLLLQHGANVNAVDRFQKTALQKAERNNHQSIIELLLKNNASPSYKQPLSLRSLSRKAFLHVDTRSGFNRLQAAVYEGEYNTFWNAHALLEDFVKEMNFQKTGSHAKFFPGKTASDILLALREKGEGNVNVEKLYKEEVEKCNTLTELHLFRCNDDVEKTVELVLNEGVDINIPAKSNRTPLLWASLSSSSEFIKTLIDLGADVNAQRTDDMVVPLMLAADWKNYMGISMLLEHGANMDIQDSKGDTALHSSVRQGFLSVSQLLTDSGCNINLRNNNEQTPLYLAAKNKHEHLVKHLVESNADVNMQYKESLSERLYLVRGTDRGRPVWHYVLVEKALLGLILKKTNGGSLDLADFGAVLKSGWGKDPPESVRMEIRKTEDTYPVIQDITVLHVVSRNDNPEIVDLLVKYKEDVNARDGEGYTPLHLAAIHGNIQVVQRLAELKADFNLTTMDGKNAADLAQMNEEREIEEYLRSKGTSFKRDVGKTEETKATQMRKYSGRRLYAEPVENSVGRFKPRTAVEASGFPMLSDISPL